MRKVMLGVLAAVSAWGLCARAETVDEAVDRLAKAAEAVKDLTAKSDMVMNATNPMTKAPMKITAAMDMQMLNDAGTRLFRTANQMTQEGALPGGAKMQITTLVVFDGQIAWVESKNPMLPQPIVVKMKMETLSRMQGGVKGGMGLGIQDVKQAVAQLKQMFDLKLLGAGTAMGRPTTRIEAIPKPEAIEKLPEIARTMMPARLVTDYDDATGTPLLMKAYDAQGKETMSTTVADLKVNAGVDKALFTYTPPEGANVQDMTGKVPAGPDAPQPTPEK